MRGVQERTVRGVALEPADEDVQQAAFVVEFIPLVDDVQEGDDVGHVELAEVPGLLELLQGHGNLPGKPASAGM